MYTVLYSQYIADDTNAPHICWEADRFIVDHFWCNKLGSTKQHLKINNKYSAFWHIYFNATRNWTSSFLDFSLDFSLDLFSISPLFSHLCIWVGVELSGQSEVDDFDLVTILGDAEDVLWFEVKVKDVLAVHVFDPITNLSHEVDAFSLRQNVILINDALK